MLRHVRSKRLRLEWVLVQRRLRLTLREIRLMLMTFLLRFSMRWLLLLLLQLLLLLLLRVKTLHISVQRPLLLFPKCVGKCRIE